MTPHGVSTVRSYRNSSGAMSHISLVFGGVSGGGGELEV
jgi:hypothetical protein